jgi:DNA mismatch repair ATPase MutS
MFFNHCTDEKLDLDLILNKINVSCIYGRDRKNQLKPFFDRKQVEIELDHLQAIVEAMQMRKPVFTKIRQVIGGMKEIRGTLKRLEDNQTLTEIEFFELKKFALNIKYLCARLEELKGIPTLVIPQRMTVIETRLDPRSDGVPTFHLYDEYSAMLKTLRKSIVSIDQKLTRAKKQLIEECAKDYGLKIRPNGMFRISKSSEQIEAVRRDERFEYVSEEFGLCQYQVHLNHTHKLQLEKLNELKRREQVEEERIKVELSHEIGSEIQGLWDNIDKVGRLDFLIGKAAFAIGYQLSRPEIDDDEIIDIQGGVNIPVRDRIRQEGLDYTPIDIVVRMGATIITGSNMGGKTVTLKLIGQIVSMAQLGLFVPAKKAKLSLRDFVYISVGDRQNIDLGLSSFAGEMVALAEVIDRSDRRGLILVDELSKGTNPQEGYAISRSITDYLNDSKSICVFTSHFDGISQGKVHYQVKGLRNIQLDVGSVITSLHQQMDYRLEEVNDQKQVPKEAIPIAEMLGLNQAIIDKARNYLYHSRGGVINE